MLESMPWRTWVEERLISGLGRVWGKDQLTALAYHRVHDPSGFDFFRPLISASSDAFARQMDIVAEGYNAISIADLLAWMAGNRSLPPNAALITFDDGYRDNLDQALPILQERELPAVLFLSTDYVGRDRPFYWDSATYFFNHTDVAEADLPILGPRSWVSPTRVCAEWIAAVKRGPQAQREEETARLGEILGVTMADSVGRGDLLTWDEVRTMGSNGFSFGSHTLSHSILTELSATQARRELAESRERIEDELNDSIRSLAYPNGSAADFSLQVEDLARSVGYSAGFTLEPGPARSSEIRARPMAIRRIGVYLPDEHRRFRAKLAGGGRVKSGLS